MNPITFEQNWSTTIQIANDIVNSIDTNTSTQINLTILDNKKHKVSINYDRNRKFLKKNYYLGSSKQSKICHHKIASCYCSSLIQNKLIKFNLSKIRSKEILSNIASINYELAFLSGLSIVYYYLIDYYELNEDISIEEREYSINHLLKNRILEYPTVSDTHDSFYEGIIKMMGIQDLNSDKFDLLGFSYIYYFIEEYNKSKINSDFNKSIHNNMLI
jgi:hypothetical protein